MRCAPERQRLWLSLASLTLCLEGSRALCAPLLEAWGELCAEGSLRLINVADASTEPSAQGEPPPAYDAHVELRPLSALLKQELKASSTLYKRGDLCLVQRAPHERDAQRDAPSLSAYLAYVDGSLGALEAAVQVTLQRLLRLRRGLLLHASGGVYEGRAWLIPGPSGAGKSTAVREGGFEWALCDEMIALTLDPTPTLWGTPFWSEGRDKARHPLTARGAPLELIATPHKALTPKLTPLGELSALSALLRCVTCYEEGRAPHEALLSLCVELLSSVPSARLSFPKGSAWRSKLSLSELKER